MALKLSPTRRAPPAPAPAPNSDLSGLWKLMADAEAKTKAATTPAPTIDPSKVTDWEAQLGSEAGVLTPAPAPAPSVAAAPAAEAAPSPPAAATAKKRLAVGVGVGVGALLVVAKLLL